MYTTHREENEIAHANSLGYSIFTGAGVRRRPGFC